MVNKLHSAFHKPKLQMLLLLFVLAGVGIVAGDDRAAKMVVLATALAAAILAEWAFFGAVATTALQSAAISGFIVGMLVSPSGNLFVAWLAAVVAIGSKKFLVLGKGKHIFNPAAFGLLFSMLIFGNRINWWGYSSVLVIIVGVGFLLFRLRRLSLPFSYIIARTATAVLIGGTGALSGALLLPNLFFAFIMLVEPKTSPGKRSEQWMFGALCGVLATVFYRVVPAYEGDLLALLVLNLFRPVVAFLCHQPVRKHTLTQT